MIFKLVFYRIFLRHFQDNMAPYGGEPEGFRDMLLREQFSTSIAVGRPDDN